MGKKCGLAGLEDDSCSPPQTYASFAGAIDKQSVQRKTADADSPTRKTAAQREIRRDCRAFVAKANAAEWGTLTRSQLDTELRELTERVGHQAFTTGLVDGGLQGVDKKNIRSSLAQRNGCGQTGWAATCNQYVGCERHYSPDWTLQKAVLKAKARFIAAI
jgi:hypothetical protein